MGSGCIPSGFIKWNCLQILASYYLIFFNDFILWGKSQQFRTHIILLNCDKKTESVWIRLIINCSFIIFTWHFLDIFTIHYPPRGKYYVCFIHLKNYWLEESSLLFIAGDQVLRLCVQSKTHVIPLFSHHVNPGMCSRRWSCGLRPSHCSSWDCMTYTFLMWPKITHFLTLQQLFII